VTRRLDFMVEDSVGVPMLAGTSSSRRRFRLRRTAVQLYLDGQNRCTLCLVDLLQFEDHEDKNHKLQPDESSENFGKDLGDFTNCA
jgi:hypothetical protein